MKIFYILVCIFSIVIVLFEKIKIKKKVSKNKKNYIDEIMLEKIDKKIKKNKSLKIY